MMLERGSSIMVQSWSEYGALFIGTMRRLKEDYGCRIHLYVGIDRDVVHYSRVDDGRLFDSVTLAGELLAHCLGPQPPRAEVLAEARANEEWLGLSYNEFAVGNRHLGRGFALGGFYFPRSRLSEQTDYWAMLHGFNTEIAFWRREFEQKKPALAIHIRKYGAVVGRKLGIPQRFLALSRYKNFHYWAINEFYESPAFERAYNRIVSAPPVEKLVPYKANMDLREAFNKQGSLFQVCLRAVFTAAQRVVWKLRGYQKGRNYYLNDQLALMFRRRRQLRQTTGRRAAQLQSLAGQRFIFFPLHAEPEAALQGMSPEYFYQLSCIAALARDLPAGALLAVKETYAAVGVRPDNFYDQIRAFKNVVLLDTMIPGPDVIRQAELVATITGTAGFEAAVMGKPVISFGHHNIYNFLPHVRLITDERDLKPALAKLLSGKFDREAGQQSGARFIAAIVQESFDLVSFDLRRRQEISSDAGEIACRALIASLTSVPSAIAKNATA